MILPRLLVDPSTLKAQTSWDILFSRRLARNRQPRSMKLPMAPGLIRAVVLMVCFPKSSLAGKQRVLLLSEATNT